ncbi:hypothetical protein ACNPHD_18060 [Klebsiella pneumoniae]|uniref:hypothetical protein n=1 Tax=Klebsiella pneumoniae TaxID=573 RepID=UPI00355C9DD1
MGVVVALISKFKVALATASAVVLVLFGAYMLGGRYARRAVEIKEICEEGLRNKKIVEAKVETSKQVASRSDDAVHSELQSDWMRD